MLLDPDNAAFVRRVHDKGLRFDRRRLLGMLGSAGGAPPSTPPSGPPSDPRGAPPSTPPSGPPSDPRGAPPSTPPEGAPAWRPVAAVGSPARS
ncbi:hypothetical protein ACFQS1_09860 [Paractinoplanes rhizophilus]|uniref:Uncharacterized protein n=1 Tax=Paractinoplanes rhizophilus TaxID=1416877 RepID=A0ABW2HMD4_9ACTN